jgi:hypothetical protein
MCRELMRLYYLPASTYKSVPEILSGGGGDRILSKGTVEAKILPKGRSQIQDYFQGDNQVQELSETRPVRASIFTT